ncbi:MAG: tetratricopeptide repeat protein [Methanotrichaceae archaeon]
MSIIHRLYLLLIFVPALMLMVSVMLDGVRCDDWPSSIQAASDEAGWRSDAYYFMNYDNCDNVNSVCGANNGTHPLNRTTGNSNADYWLNDANRLYLTGSYEQAAESYAKAVNLDPSLSKGWLNLGNSLYYLGKYQASLNTYNAALRLEPKNANALSGKDRALLALNKTGVSNMSTITSSTVQGPKIANLAHQNTVQEILENQW